jgi:hypothetical protein
MAKNTPDTNKPVTGRTLWDVLQNIFSGKPLTVIITIAILISIFIILVLSGVLTIRDGKISISRPTENIHDSLPEKIGTNNNMEDVLLQFCITKGNELKKKYVLKSIIQSYDAELIGKLRDTLLVKERITYDLLALEDIAKDEDVFVEDYSSVVADKVERWFGTNRENTMHMGNQQKYVVQIECKKGEGKTIVTGADFYYRFPLANDRNSTFRNFSLAHNEDLWIYPNTEDVVGKHTMIFNSRDLALEPNAQGALHTIGSSAGKINNDCDGFYNANQNSETSTNRSISYTWYKILPDETFALKVKWR